MIEDKHDHTGTFAFKFQVGDIEDDQLYCQGYSAQLVKL